MTFKDKLQRVLHAGSISSNHSSAPTDSSSPSSPQTPNTPYSPLARSQTTPRSPLSKTLSFNLFRSSTHVVDKQSSAPPALVTTTTNTTNAPSSSPQQGTQLQPTTSPMQRKLQVRREHQAMLGTFNWDQDGRSSIQSPGGVSPHTASLVDLGRESVDRNDSTSSRALESSSGTRLQDHRGPLTSHAVESNEVVGSI